MKTAALFVAVALAGCAADHPANSPYNRPVVPAEGVAAEQPAWPRDGRASSLGAKEPGTESSIAPPLAVDAAAVPPETAAALSDGQIIQVVHTANLGEIDQGTLALSKTKDARVKQLATMMVKDHTAADAKGMSLAKTDSLDLAPSTVSMSLDSDAQAATSSLKGKTGSDFDVAYVDTQVKEHQTVLDLIDQTLAPAAKNPDLKGYLADVRPTIAMHLQHAQDLQKAMRTR